MQSVESSQISLDNKITELVDQELLNFIKNNPTYKFSTYEINYIMNTPSIIYSQIVYFLSENNKIFDFKNYKKTFLFFNYEKFNEEDLKYLSEAMKNQILQGHDDPYIVLEHFLKNILKSSALQRYFIYITSKTLCCNINLNYKIREFIITNKNFLEKIFKCQNLSNIFKGKLIFNLFNNYNEILMECLEEKKYTVVFKDLENCMIFFTKYEVDPSIMNISLK